MEIDYEDIEKYEEDPKERILAKMEFRRLYDDIIALQSLAKQVKSSITFAKLTDADYELHQELQNLHDKIGHGEKFLEVPDVRKED